MGIAASALFGVGNGDVAHAFDRALPGFCLGHLVVRQNRFGNLFADAHDWIERCHGLLKNHRNARAAKFAQGIGREIKKACRVSVAVLKVDFAGHGGSGRKQAHDGQ